jgi:hypothetical protein
MQGHASLCTKRREGVFRLRLKRYKFRPQQSNLNMDEKGKNILQWMDKYTQYCLILDYSFFAKIIQKLLSSIQADLKRNSSSLRNALQIIKHQHHHPADKQWYKVKSNYESRQATCISSVPV